MRSIVVEFRTPSAWRRPLMAFAVTLLGLLHVASVSAQTTALTTAAQLPAAYKPVGIPSNYVVTPAGYFDPSCVQRLQRGEELRGDGQVRKTDGSVRAVAACKNSHFNGAGKEVPASASAVPTTGTAPLPSDGRNDTSGIDHAYVEAATWVIPNNNTIRRMTAEWTVPANPSVSSAGVLFFFPGLEDISNTRSILQPVLGYNAYGANHIWTIASWNCCIAGNAFASEAVQTYPGARIYGEMVANCAVGQTCTHWNVTTTDLTNNTTTVLSNSDTLDQNFNWVFGIALEVYGITNCRQYPRDGSMHIDSIKLWDFNNNPVSATWGDSGSQSGLTPSCLYHVDSSAPTTITLSY